MNRTIIKIALVGLIVVMTAESASAYVAYVVGRKTYAGCNPNDGNTCVMKIELPGPPEIPELTGEASINTYTTTQIGDHLFVSSAANPGQYWSQGGYIIANIWHTDDDSECPIPNP